MGLSSWEWYFNEDVVLGQDRTSLIEKADLSSLSPVVIYDIFIQERMVCNKSYTVRQS